MNWETRVTKLLGIKYPIIQGGLAHLAYSDLAAAVSNAGGLGQITAMSLETPEELKAEIQKVKKLTNQPYGVNFAIGQHNRPYENMLEAALEQEVPVITMTGGNPSEFFKRVENSNAKIMILVASKRHAQKAEALGADAVMVVGQEGGGHIGKLDTGTMVLVPQVVDAVKIPVIASGGIGDGRGLMASFALGAEGVEMGTRFIAVKECVHAHENYKNQLVAGSEIDTIVIKRTLGAPGRAVVNKWAEKIVEIEENGGTYEDLKKYISGKANIRFARDGAIDDGFGWAGQIMGRIHNIPTVQELFDSIFNEAKEIRDKWRTL